MAYGYQDGGKGRGDYTIHQRALDATLNASDGDNVINYTVWTYCVDKSVLSPLLPTATETSES